MPTTSSAPPAPAITAPMASERATSATQPVQSCVTSPTSLARSRAIARSGSGVRPATTEMAAAVAAPASTGRRRAISRSGGRRTKSTRVPMPIAIDPTASHS